VRVGQAIVEPFESLGVLEWIVRQVRCGNTGFARLLRALPQRCDSANAVQYGMFRPPKEPLSAIVGTALALWTVEILEESGELISAVRGRGNTLLRYDVCSRGHRPLLEKVVLGVTS
jgi:hypothetical protein